MFRSPFVALLCCVGLISLGIPAAAEAQFERIDRMVRQTEDQAIPTNSVSLTPAMLLGDLFDMSYVDVFMIQKLEWEVQKLQFQQQSLQSALEKLTTQNQFHENEMVELRLALNQIGVDDETSLRKQVQRDRETEMERGRLQAQLDALKKAIDAQHAQASRQRDLGKAIMETEIQDHRREVERLNELAETKEKHFSAGVASSEELAIIRRQLEVAVTQLKIAQLKMEQAHLVSQQSPEQNQQLTNLTAQLASLELETTADRFDSAKLTKINQQLLREKRLVRQHELGLQRIGSTEERLFDVELELEYLTTVLKKYREAAAKMDKPSEAQPATQSKAGNGNSKEEEESGNVDK